MRRLLPLLLLLALLLLFYLSYSTHRAYCETSDSFWCTGHIEWPKASTPAPEPPPSTPPHDASLATPATPYPSSAVPDHATPDHEPPPPPPPAPLTHAPIAGPPPYSVAPDPVFNVPFFEAKANLLPEALTALRDAAMRALETEKVVKLRIMALGPRENDDDLWRRRFQAVKDELVRLGVPADRIMQDGNDVIVRQRVVHNTRTSRQRVTMELIPDPMAGDDDQ